jgi:hypothetical protein
MEYSCPLQPHPYLLKLTVMSTWKNCMKHSPAMIGKTTKDIPAGTTARRSSNMDYHRITAGALISSGNSVWILINSRVLTIF